MSIVVGVDGSASALDAVRAATIEAARRRTGLRIVHAFMWPLMHVPLGPSPSGPDNGGLRNEADRILAEAAETAFVTDPMVKVDTRLITGAPTAVLLVEAASADLVVIGDRGLGPISERLIGSVAVQVAERSPVPVLVVKRHVPRRGPVLVGIDGSPASSRALALAFDEGDRRGAEIIAAHVRDTAAPSSAERNALVPATLARRSGPRTHTEAIETERRRVPEVTATEEILVGDAGEALVARARHAQLAVVGANARSGFLGLFMGSVARHVLRHAACPVLIVPAPTDGHNGATS